MTRMNRPKEMAKRNKKIALIAEAMEWIMEHPDAPIDPMLRELAKIVMSGVKREDEKEADEAEEAEIKG